MVVPQMLNPELVGRSPVECTELCHRTDVGLLGAGRQIAIMRRRNGLIALSVMEVLLSWERSWQPLDHKTGRFHPATAVLLPHPLSPALPRQRFSAMTGYGMGGLPTRIEEIVPDAHDCAHKAVKSLLLRSVNTMCARE